MKAYVWLIAFACLFAFNVSASAPNATAADMTLTACQTLEDETKLANQYGWQEVKVITGDQLSLFLGKYNAEPPITSLKADTVHFFKKPGVAQIGIVFVLNGCVIKREFMSPVIVEKLLGAAL